jgi:hypothetical protein
MHFSQYPFTIEAIDEHLAQIAFILFNANSKTKRKIEDFRLIDRKRTAVPVKRKNAFASNVTTVGYALAGFGAVGALAIGKTVVASSNLEEQTDRTRDQFGKFADQVINQSNLLATAFGLSKVATLESASVLSAIFESAGYAGQGVADLSVHFVKLSTDLSRFANIPFKEALRKIESGLVGQVRPLREVGVALSEAATDAYAYAHGIAKVGAELTDSEKVQARAGFIAEALTKSWGNTAKTGDKVAGAIEGVKGRFENLAATIGDSLLLIAAPLLGDLQVGLQALQTSWVGAGQSAVNSSAQMAGGIQGVHGTIGPFQHSIGFIADAWQNVTFAFNSFQLIAVSGISDIVSAMALFEKSLRSVANLIPGIKIEGPSFIEVFAQELDRTQKMLAEQNTKLIKAPPASEAINKAFEQGRKDIAAARDKLAKMGKLDVLSIKPTNAAAVAGKEHKGFAAAGEFGSQEAANVILRSNFGMAASGPAEKTAQNTAKIALGIDKLNAHFAGQAGGLLLNAF